MNKLCNDWGIKLDIPNFIYDLTDEYIDNHSNGCGSTYSDIIVPDNILGVNICACCRIHDLQYNKGGNDSDRYNSDRLFKKNMTILIKKRRNYFLKKLNWWQFISKFSIKKFYKGRLSAVKLYYYMVRKYGKGSFSYEK